MDLSTLIGMVFGLALVVGAIVLEGNWVIFLSPKSVMIVIGVTLAGTIINYSFKMFIDMVKHTKRAFIPNDNNPADVIEIMVGFAEKARREGLLALEDEGQDLDNDFLKKGIQLVVDGTDPELVKNIMETKLSFFEESNNQFQDMYGKLAEFAPAFGMIGTLIGLVQMLAKLDDPSSIGAGMATALITTLYGSFLANFLFIPLAGKLELRASEEILVKELMIEGLLSIQAGENPRIVEEKLKAFLTIEQRQEKSAEEEFDDMDAAVGEGA